MTLPSFEDFIRSIQNGYERFREKSLGFIVIAVTSAVVLLNELFGFQLLPLMAKEITRVNPIYLFVVGLFLFAVLVLFPLLRLGVRLVLLVVSIILCIPWVMATVRPQPDDLVIVYDAASRNMYPRDLSTRAVDLGAIDKLRQTSDVSPDSLFLSIVERPVENWQPVLSRGFRPKREILSLREILDSDDPLFVDVSASDFVSEIVHVLNSGSHGSGPYVVYFTETYQRSAALLEQSMRDALPSSSIVLIAYQGRRTGLIHPHNAVLIYLGSSSQFPDFVRHMSTRGYGKLVAPNWTAAEIDTRPNTAIASRPDSASSKSVLVISSPARRLAEADVQQWSKVIEYVRMAREQRADVGSFVGNKLSRGMTVETISFEEARLLR